MRWSRTVAQLFYLRRDVLGDEVVLRVGSIWSSTVTSHLPRRRALLSSCAPQQWFHSLSSSRPHCLLFCLHPLRARRRHPSPPLISHTTLVPRGALSSRLTIPDQILGRASTNLNNENPVIDIPNRHLVSSERTPTRHIDDVLVPSKTMMPLHAPFCRQFWISLRTTLRSGPVRKGRPRNMFSWCSLLCVDSFAFRDQDNKQNSWQSGVHIHNAVATVAFNNNGNVSSFSSSFVNICMSMRVFRRRGY